jgi:hypothetical protein
MPKRISLALPLAALPLLAACVTEISNEERLDRDTARTQAGRTSTASELVKLRCDDLAADLLKARDETRSEEYRLTTTLDLLEKVKGRVARFDEAISHNPDLAYQEGSQEVTGARDGCVQTQADVRLDLEGLVREVIQQPVVDEMKGSATVKSARLSFELLRTAIEKLELDDKDALFSRLALAERQVDSREPKKKR